MSSSLESVILEYSNVLNFIYFVNMKKILKKCLNTLYNSFKIDLRLIQSPTLKNLDIFKKNGPYFNEELKNNILHYLYSDSFISENLKRIEKKSLI